MKFYIYILYIFLFVMVGCKDSKNIDDSKDITLQNEKWIFNTQYIKVINDSSWEKLSIIALNNYKDFKIDLSFISTGKPQTCGLYAKGILANESKHINNKDKTKKFLLRPNLIPNTTIWLIQDKDNKSIVRLEVSNMVSFIQMCGDAHQYVVGDYEATK